MIKSKPKILFIMQLPPPVHGASVMNNYIFKSKIINAEFDTTYLPLKFVSKVSEIGRFSFRKLFLLIKIVWLILKTIYTLKPDVVYYTIAPFGGAFYRDSLLVFLIKLFRPKIVFHLHGKGIDGQCKSTFKRKIYQLTFKDVSVITLSKMLNYDIEKVYNGKIYNIPNDIEVHQTAIKNKNPYTCKMLYLSNLVKTKGILDLVTAIELVKDLEVDYEVDIVGNSADITVDSLKEIILTKNLQNRVNVLGPKYGNEKWQMLHNADILVFPTFFKNECFPLVILEAMQTQTAIISTDNGAIKEIIKDCGIITPQSSPEKLAFVLRELLQDSNRIQKLKVKAKAEFDKKYTLEKFEINFIQTLKKILNEN